jgi:hypothetical protein
MKNFSTNFFGRKLTYALTVLLALSVSLSGCSKKDDNPPATLGNANVMVIHASPDAPAMDLYVNDVRKGTPIAVLSNTSYLQIEEGNKTFKLTETNKLTPTFATASQNLRKNAYYSLFVFNRAASTENVMVEDSLTNTTAGKAFLRFVHLSNNTPAVAVTQVTSAGLVVITPFTAYKGHTLFKDINPGDLVLALQETNLNTAYIAPSYNYVAGKFYTVIAQNLLTTQGTDSLSVRVIENQK